MLSVVVESMGRRKQSARRPRYQLLDTLEQEEEIPVASGGDAPSKKPRMVEDNSTSSSLTPLSLTEEDTPDAKSVTAAPLRADRLPHNLVMMGHVPVGTPFGYWSVLGPMLASSVAHLSDKELDLAKRMVMTERRSRYKKGSGGGEEKKKKTKASKGRGGGKPPPHSSNDIGTIIMSTTSMSTSITTTPLAAPPLEDQTLETVDTTGADKSLHVM